jgi:hypothetical protein
MCVIGDRTTNRLADPPACLGPKLVASPIVELVDRPHQTDISFQDQIEELRATI